MRLSQCVNRLQMLAGSQHIHHETELLLVNVMKTHLAELARPLCNVSTYNHDIHTGQRTFLGLSLRNSSEDARTGVKGCSPE